MCGTNEIKRLDDRQVDEDYLVICSSRNMFVNKVGNIKCDKWAARHADGFAACGEQKVFYANYSVQRPCWVGWEDKKYHLDENGFVKT